MASGGSDEDRRVRTMTDKARPIYEERVNKQFRILAQLKSNLEATIDLIDRYSDDNVALQEISDHLHDGMTKFYDTVQEFKQYLDSQHTEESIQETAVVDHLYSEVNNMVKDGLRKIKSILKPNEQPMESQVIQDSTTSLTLRSEAAESSETETTEKQVEQETKSEAENKPDHSDRDRKSSGRHDKVHHIHNQAGCF